MNISIELNLFPRYNAAACELSAGTSAFIAVTRRVPLPKEGNRVTARTARGEPDADVVRQETRSYGQQGRSSPLSEMHGEQAHRE